MKIVPITPEHMLEIGGEIPRQSVRGHTMLSDDGRVLGCAGSYHHHGHVMVWLEATDELRQKPIALMKLCKSLYKFPHKTVFAHCDKQFEAAERFLAHFGFWDRGDGIWVKEKK